MPTPIPSSLRAAGASASRDPSVIDRQEWRCLCCRKLLGICYGRRLHLRFARSHELIATLPAQATCRGCGTMNEALAPSPGRTSGRN